MKKIEFSDKGKIERLARKKGRRTLKSRQRYKKRKKNKQRLKEIYGSKDAEFLNELKNDFSIENKIDKWMPDNLKFMLLSKDSDFHVERLVGIRLEEEFKVPQHFSIIEHPDESYDFIKSILAAIIIHQVRIIEIDYENCHEIDLGAQVFLDLILKDAIQYHKKCSRSLKTSLALDQINAINTDNPVVEKLLHSVGSFAIHTSDVREYEDIEPYRLCSHNRNKSGDPEQISAQKDIDTTNLVDYVNDSLSRLGKKLSPERLDDLCTVVSEILINAEEHSTTKWRYSIGYFQEINDGKKHDGIFRLVILNFGDSIYQKFKNPNCPRQDIVLKMNSLSKEYAKNNFFSPNFEEETLWTLYALQEEVTSVPKEAYRKRGNGSIRFIDSFFKIKGDNEKDEFSKMAILSGNTSIIFDGKHKMSEKTNKKNERFQVMAFNKENDISQKPDSKYVKFVKNQFPGTIISAKLMFNDDDYVPQN